MIIAESFFDSSSFTLARNLSGFFVVVFWLATAFWVYKDARRRIFDLLHHVEVPAGVLGQHGGRQRPGTRRRRRDESIAKASEEPEHLVDVLVAQDRGADRVVAGI